jgi:TonB family protein
LALLALIVAFGTSRADRLDAQAAVAASQSTLTGVVRDPTHAPLPGLTVVVEDLARRKSYRATTDRQGRFEFRDLPAGDVEAEVTVPGFAEFRQRVLVAGPLVELEVLLVLDRVEETFTVAADSPPTSSDVLGRERGEVEPCVVPLDSETQSPIGGQVRPPRMLTRVVPAFPEHLRDAELEGQVRLSARISDNGTPADLTILEASHPDYAAAAEDAVRNWTWEEGLLNCTPVDFNVSVTVQFLPQRP